jgi:transcriptional regulator with XRE-family HTH domain
MFDEAAPSAMPVDEWTTETSAKSGSVVAVSGPAVPDQPTQTEEGTAGEPTRELPGSRSITETLGLRLRELRSRRGLTLRSVAAKAQVSASLLSQIERGEASPSLLSLVAIADALAVRPGDLLDDHRDATPHSPVVRRSERRVIDDAECRREYMMHLDDPYLVDVAELLIAPGGASRPALAGHSGRDYGVVVEGEIIVELGERREVLDEGDYIAFDADEPHRIVNETARPARVLWIIANEARPSRAARPVRAGAPG